MKHLFSTLLFLLALSSSTAMNPDGCTCGTELAKPIAEPDREIMDACAQKGEAMKDKEKVRWFEDIMNCVE